MPIPGAWLTSMGRFTVLALGPQSRKESFLTVILPDVEKPLSIWLGKILGKAEGTLTEATSCELLKEGGHFISEQLVRYLPEEEWFQKDKEGTGYIIFCEDEKGNVSIKEILFNSRGWTVIESQIGFDDVLQLGYRLCFRNLHQVQLGF